MVNEVLAWEMYLINRDLNYLIDHCENKKELAITMTKISKKVFEMVHSEITDEEGKADD